MSTKSTKSTKIAKGVKDISSMRTMERYWYMRDNYKVCPTCNDKKRLSAFWNKQDNTINENCNPCNKKLYEIEVTKIVLGVLKKDEVL